MDSFDINFEEVRELVFQENFVCNSSQERLCQYIKQISDQYCAGQHLLVIIHIIQNLDFFRVYLISYIVINFVLFLTAILGNGPIIIVIFRSRNLHSPSYILIASLAVTDILVGVLVHTALIGWCFRLLQSKIEVLCPLMAVFDIGTVFLGAASQGTSLLISIDRYLALSRMQQYRLVVTKKKTIIAVIVVWVLSIVITVIGLGRVDVRSRTPFYMGNLGIVPLVFTIVFYVLASRRLHQYTRQVQARNQRKMQRQREEHTQRQEQGEKKGQRNGQEPGQGHEEGQEEGQGQLSRLRGEERQEQGETQGQEPEEQRRRRENGQGMEIGQDQEEGQGQGPRLPRKQGQGQERAHGPGQEETQVHTQARGKARFVAQEVGFNIQKYRKTLKTMVVILLCLIFCFVPYLCGPFLWIRQGQEGLKFITTFQLSSLLAFALNSSINPLIYLIRFKDIRRSCQQLLRR